VASIVLIGPNSRSEDFSPHGLFEKVFWPLVVHSQICPGGAAGSVTAGIAWDSDWAGGVGGAGTGNGSADNCGGELLKIAEGEGSISAIAGEGVCRGFAAVPALPATAITAATVAVAIAPKIQGPRSLYLYIRLTLRFSTYRCEKVRTCVFASAILTPTNNE
jgi:hypothetical protein